MLSLSKIVLYGGLGAMIGMVCFLLAMTFTHVFALIKQRKQLKENQASNVSEQANNSTVLKVVSFNIRCCDDKNGNSISERAPRLFKVISPYNADVLGLQEYTPKWESEIKRYFGDEYDMFNKYRTTTGWVESGPILWRKNKFELLNSGCFWLSDTPEIESFGGDESKHNRICTYVTLKEIASGKIFTFFNTHFGFGEEYQLKSAKIICEYVKKISSYPTFLTGDFNLTPDSIVYKEITKHLRDVNALTTNDWRPTFHGYCLPPERNEHIDYCFIDDKIVARNSHLIDELDNGLFPSDHYGLYSEIEIL